MAYLVSGTDLTAVANAIRTAGETSAPLKFPSGFVAAIGNISGGGGGATNVVTGTFTTSVSEKGTVKAVSIPYAGNGFPVACIIYPHGGYNTGMDIYNLVQYKAVIMFSMLKSNETAPDYSTSNVEKNWALLAATAKNSSSDATNLYVQVSKGAIEFTSYAPNSNAGINTVRFSSASQMNVFVASDEYGLLDGIQYDYMILYSE